MEPFHHRHDYDLVTRVLYFMDNLIKSSDVILSAFPIFLMQSEEVGDGGEYERRKAARHVEL